MRQPTPPYAAYSIMLASLLLALPLCAYASSHKSAANLQWQILEESQVTYAINDFIENRVQQIFEPTQTLSGSRSHYWLKSSVIESPESSASRTLSFGRTSATQLSLYILDLHSEKPTLHHHREGLSAEKPKSANNLVLNVELPPRSQLYIHLNAAHRSLIDINFVDPSHFLERKLERTHNNGMLSAALVAATTLLLILIIAGRQWQEYKYICTFFVFASLIPLQQGLSPLLSSVGNTQALAFTHIASCCLFIWACQYYLQRISQNSAALTPLKLLSLSIATAGVLALYFGDIRHAGVAIDSTQSLAYLGLILISLVSFWALLTGKRHALSATIGCCGLLLLTLTKQFTFSQQSWIQQHCYELALLWLELMLLLSLSRNFSRLERAQKDTHTAVQNAYKSSRAKSDFLAQMSHEIRTPMNGVLGMAQVVLETELDRNQRQYMDTLYRSGKNLLRIINDILDYSKIEAGKLDIERTQFDLIELLADIAAPFQPKAEEKNLQLVVNTQAGITEKLSGDPLRLGQILTNLLSNAFKFTEQGQITLSVNELAPQPGKPRTLEFRVEDSGIGIPPDRVNKLFQPFEQADTSTTRHFGGTGLGLSISKQLIELMGGEIGVESNIGRGSCFWLKLPLAVQANQIQLCEKTRGLAGKRIYYLDDQSLYLKAAVKHLKHWKIQCRTENNAHHAQIHLLNLSESKNHYDLIIISEKIRNIAALDILQRLNKHPTLNKTPKLILKSAYTDNSELNELAFSCLRPTVVPLLRQDILDALQGDWKGKTQAIQKKQKRNDHFQSLKLLIAEDNAINRTVIAAMLKKFNIKPDFAVNGIEAVNAYEQRAYDLIFMDCEMPEMDGFEATQKIRSNEKIHHKKSTPIIALTAHVLAEYKKKSSQSGMNDHLSKPVNLSDIEQILEKWTHMK